MKKRFPHIILIFIVESFEIFVSLWIGASVLCFQFNPFVFSFDILFANDSISVSLETFFIRIIPLIFSLIFIAFDFFSYFSTKSSSFFLSFTISSNIYNENKMYPCYEIINSLLWIWNFFHFINIYFCICVLITIHLDTIVTFLILEMS